MKPVSRAPYGIGRKCRQVIEAERLSVTSEIKDRVAKLEFEPRDCHKHFNDRMREIVGQRTASSERWIKRKGPVNSGDAFMSEAVKSSLTIAERGISRTSDSESVQVVGVETIEFGTHAAIKQSGGCFGTFPNRAA
jgi:hypothetical protein